MKENFQQLFHETTTNQYLAENKLDKFLDNYFNNLQKRGWNQKLVIKKELINQILQTRKLSYRHLPYINIHNKKFFYYKPFIQSTACILWEEIVKTLGYFSRWIGEQEQKYINIKHQQLWKTFFSAEENILFNEKVANQNEYFRSFIIFQKLVATKKTIDDVIIMIKTRTTSHLYKELLKRCGSAGIRKIIDFYYISPKSDPLLFACEFYLFIIIAFGTHLVIFLLVFLLLLWYFITSLKTTVFMYVCWELSFFNHLTYNNFEKNIDLTTIIANCLNNIKYELYKINLKNTTFSATYTSTIKHKETYYYQVALICEKNAFTSIKLDYIKQMIYYLRETFSIEDVAKVLHLTIERARQFVKILCENKIIIKTNKFRRNQRYQFIKLNSVE